MQSCAVHPTALQPKQSSNPEAVQTPTRARTTAVFKHPLAIHGPERGQQ